MTWILQLDALDWMDQAACRDEDPNLFFSKKGQATAKEICQGCNVRDECLSEALFQRQRFGVWGGLGEAERRKLLRGTRKLCQVRGCGVEINKRATYCPKHRLSRGASDSDEVELWELEIDGAPQSVAA